MTDLTTTHLKHLLDQSTPGLWKFDEKQEWEYVAGPGYPPMLTYDEHIVEDGDGKFLFGLGNDKTLVECPGNLRLAALAPQLAQEVINLRDALGYLVEETRLAAENSQDVIVQKRVADAIKTTVAKIQGDHDE
ncbi:hypothetical protein [Corynebacterium sp. KPL2825]|uniref:hypothetical protein n=1 Tax=Corynebacterium sp. KPL2825 TaxID=3135444 RepID=UPI0030C9C7F5